MMFILLNTTVGKAKLLLTIFFLLVFSLGYSQCCDLYVKMEVADDLFGEGAQVVLTVRSNGGVIYTDNFDSGGTGTKTAVINVCEGDNIQFEVNDSRFIPFSTTSLQVLNSNGVLFQSLPDPNGTVFTTSNACSSGTLAPCSADAGTVSVFVDGVQVDETQTVYICYDQGGVSDIGVYSNDDVTLPPPYPGEVSELMLAVFTMIHLKEERGDHVLSNCGLR